MIQVDAKHINNTMSAEREKRYKRFTAGAKEYQNKKDIHRMALCLYVIQNEKLYLEGGYTSVYDLGTKLLGVSNGTISGYISIAKKFLDTNTGKTIFATDKGDFGYLQLLEMKKLKVEEAKELVSNGTITFNSTASEIKQAVSDYLSHIKAEEVQAKEDSIKPIKTAYEGFHKAYNELCERVGDDDTNKNLLQSIMDSVVVLYNENDRLWN